jgi:hypothetical protein
MDTRIAMVSSSPGVGGRKDGCMSYKNKLDKRQRMKPRLNLEPVIVGAAIDPFSGDVRYLTEDDIEIDGEGYAHIKSEVYESLTMTCDPIAYIPTWASF